MVSIGAAIVGFEGTSGSVSLSDGLIAMPEMEVSFTLGQSLDETFKIQLETGHDGVGGVLPVGSHQIPSTVKNLNMAFKWQLKRATDGLVHPSAHDMEMDFAEAVASSKAHHRVNSTQDYLYSRNREHEGKWRWEGDLDGSHLTYHGGTDHKH